MKQIRVMITTTVIDECEGRTDGAECRGGDHHGVEITVGTGVGDVPPAELDAALAQLFASGGAEVIARLQRTAPWMFTGDGAPPPDFVPPVESDDDAPSLADLAALLGPDADPDRAPRNFEELAELMARNGAGIVEISDLEELRPLKDALERALDRDPDRG